MAMDGETPGGVASCVITGHCDAALAVAHRACNQARLVRSGALHPAASGTRRQMFPHVQVPHAALGARSAACTERRWLDPGRGGRREADAPGTLAALRLGRTAAVVERHKGRDGVDWTAARPAVPPPLLHRRTKAPARRAAGHHRLAAGDRKKLAPLEGADRARPLLHRSLLARARPEDRAVYGESTTGWEQTPWGTILGLGLRLHCLKDWVCPPRSQ